VIAMPIVARAQKADIGKQEYENYCAVCHGADGKGDRPLAHLLKQKGADLTILQKDNNGVFPVQRVHEIIDGTKPVSGHGTPDMPAWGVQFMKQAPPFGSRYGQSEFVTARILALIDYINRMQAK
jgi:mono/diheme cytochrome c family protein